MLVLTNGDYSLELHVLATQYMSRYTREACCTQIKTTSKHQDKLFFALILLTPISILSHMPRWIVIFDLQI